MASLASPKRRTVKSAFFGPQLVNICQCGGGQFVQSRGTFVMPSQTKEFVPAIATGSVAAVLTMAAGIDSIRAPRRPGTEVALASRLWLPGVAPATVVEVLTP